MLFCKLLVTGCDRKYFISKVVNITLVYKGMPIWNIDLDENPRYFILILEFLFAKI